MRHRLVVIRKSSPWPALVLSVLIVAMGVAGYSLVSLKPQPSVATVAPPATQAEKKGDAVAVPIIEIKRGWTDSRSKSKVEDILSISEWRPYKFEIVGVPRTGLEADITLKKNKFWRDFGIFSTKGMSIVWKATSEDGINLGVGIVHLPVIREGETGRATLYTGHLGKVHRLVIYVGSDDDY